MYSDENKSSSLARFLNTFDYAMIDTCSLMDEAFPEWMDALHNAKEYRKKGQKILVPRRCYDELKKHARQRKDDSKRIDAKRGLKILRKARFSHLLSVTKKDKSENFADNAIYVKVCADRLFSKILVITQDKSLASDLRALNLLKSQSGRPLEVCKIVPGARLVPNKGEENPHREHGKGHNGPEPQKTNGPASSVEAVLSADARLSAVLGNSNYPSDKKKADALAQIKLLEKLNDSTRQQLSLLVPLPRLKEVAGLTKPQQKVEKKSEPKPQPKKTEEPKPAEKKPEPNRLWYGVGKTMADAFLDCAKHYGMAFHEPSVIYFPDAHGPLDLTTDDLKAIEAMGTPLLRGEEKISFVYRGLTLMTLQTPEKFKAWIDVNNLPKELTPLTKPSEEKAKPAPKPRTKKKAEKPEEPKAEPVGEAKSVPARKKPAKKAETPQKAEQKPDDAQVKEQKPAPQKAPKTKATKAKAPKAEEPKKPEPEAKEEPKPSKPKAARKPKAKPEEEPKAKEEPKVDEAFEKAKKADQRLCAVLPNGKYALKDKLKDLEAQKKLLAGLSQEQTASLKFSVEAIDAWIAENGTKGE
ncbi:MAG: hypothetical protein E7182_00540 [Erysipelotrichaceae bacterium]|nr:hypothetical protein [Erysipelotrichaceae bacterium]